MDRTLAKEAGLVPRLRCVGVMTTGDFFGPEAMTDQRAGDRVRGPRVIPSGSYRIRSAFDSGVDRVCFFMFSSFFVLVF